MKQPIIIIGQGEMGGVFARGFLRNGHPVYPITREMNLSQFAEELANPLMVLVAVAEKDLHPVLEQIPSVWHDRVALLQNELLPEDWEHYPFSEPSVISVWFEKKKGQEPKVIIPSPVIGPHSQLIKDSLALMNIPVEVVTNKGDMLIELVLKNLYILTSNIAGLKVGGTVAELWQNHPSLARAVAHDALLIQEALTQKTFNEEILIRKMVAAFMADPDHKCMGRSAPARLQRALRLAEEFSLTVESMEQINQEQSSSSRP